MNTTIIMIIASRLYRLSCFIINVRWSVAPLTLGVSYFDFDKTIKFSPALCILYPFFNNKIALLISFVFVKSKVMYFIMFVLV